MPDDVIAASGTGTPEPAAVPITPVAKLPETPGTVTPVADGTKVVEPTGVQTPAAAQPVSVVPEKYDLKPKDGVSIPASMLETTATTARTLGLSQEHAQALLDFTADQVKAVREEMQASNSPGGDAWKTRTAKWEADALADTAIGGTPEQLQTSVALGQRVLGTFFEPSVLTFLRDSGMGSHPDVIRGFAKIGKSMSEGTFVSATPKTGDVETDAANKLYGGTKDKTSSKE